MFEIKEDCLLITLPREVDHHVAGIISKQADYQMMDERVRQLVFDFGQTEFMDSSGIGLLAGRNDRITFLGGRTIIVNANPRIKQMLTFAGMDKELL